MPWIFNSLRTVLVGWAPRGSQARTRPSSKTTVDGSVWALYRPTVSITRPSRGERWSATTTRQIGSCFPPTRVSLRRTDMRPRRVAPRLPRRPVRVPALVLPRLPHEHAEVGHLALPHALH